MQSGHMKGSHFYSMYYGESHLISKALPFVMEGVAENARILLVLQPQVRQLLISALSANGMETPPAMLGPLPLHELTEYQKKHGPRGLRQGLLKYVEQARTDGFHRLRIVLSVTQDLMLVGQTFPEFQQWKKRFHEASAGLPVTTLWLYDAALSVSEGELLRLHENWSLLDRPMHPRDTAK